MDVLLRLVLLLSASSVLSARRVIYREVPGGQPEPMLLFRQATSGLKAEPLDSDTNFMNALKLVGHPGEPEAKEDETKWGFFNSDNVVTVKPPTKETIVHHHYITYPATAQGGSAPYPSYPPPYPYPGYYPAYPHTHHHHHATNYPYPGYPPYHPNGYPRPNPYLNPYTSDPGQPPMWSGWYKAPQDGQNGYSYPDEDELEKYGRRPRKLSTESSTVQEAAAGALPAADQ